MVHTGDVYLIPLRPGRQAKATILYLGSPPYNSHFATMLVEVPDCLFEGVLPTRLPVKLMVRYWCPCYFVERGNWTLVRRGTSPDFEFPWAAEKVWPFYEIFLGALRIRFGLERKSDKPAQCTFSEYCKACRRSMYLGWARCPKCREIRREFHGLERFVVDQNGSCCLSSGGRLNSLA
jgi:hypothetical protein